MVHYYVNSDTGNDANNGSDGNPLATITQAFTLIDAIEVSDAGPHEIIITNDGIYNEGNLGLEPLLGFNTVVYIMAQTGSDTGLPVVTPTIQGSGSTVQARSLFVGKDWIIRGLKFQNWVLSSGNAVIEQRSYGDATPPATTVELCEFTKITGSCMTFDLGGADNGQYIIQSNTFHDILIPSSSLTDTIIVGGSGVPKWAYIYNNVFYDIQYGNVNANLINCNVTSGKNPYNIISHNTFGTSSVQDGTTYNPTYVVEATYSKFEYNIIHEQTANTGDANSSFARLDNGEANYNIYYNVSGQSSNAPFGGLNPPTGAANNRLVDPLFKGPLAGSNANYRLASTSSPAFDAAIGSSDVTNDRTGVSRATLDRTALNTGIFDIGAYELTGLWSNEQPDSLPQVGGDFTINRIPNADNQWKRGLSEGNSGIIGHDVDQVPLTTAINGAVPSFIRKRPTANTQTTGKKG